MSEAVGYALLTCDASAKDPSGKLTLYGIFDQIQADSFPSIHPAFSVFWRCWIPEPGKISVKIVQPGGVKATDLDTVDAGRPGMGEMTVMGTYACVSFEFPVPGVYRLVLLYDEKELMQTTMDVQERKKK